MACSEGGLSSLPDELLTALCRIIGVQGALTSLVANSKLHRTWQNAAESLFLTGQTINDGDIAIIAKFVELKKLSLSHINGELAIWLIIGLLAPRLPLLTTLAIVHGHDPYSVLKTVVGTEGLRTRLQDLTLIGDYDICSSDLRSVAELKGLTSLHLEASCIECTEADVPQFNGTLPSISKFVLCTTDAVDAHILSQFPGCLTNLTSLALCTYDITDVDQQESGGQPLAAAASCLANLHLLDSNYHIGCAATQRQALQQLSCLTFLEIDQGLPGERFVVLDQLPSLRALEAPWASLGEEALTHPSLTRLAAARLSVDAAWRDRVAESCLLEAVSFDLLALDDLVEDDDLANLPTLPRLSSFSLDGLHPFNGKYAHLASFLHRHAAGLRDISISLPAAFEHGLTRELPACKSLSLRDGFVSWHTLQVLSTCTLPKLEQLVLCVNVDIELQLDLGWVAQLPALKHLHVFGTAFTAAGGAVIKGWLPGKSVMVNRRHL